MRISGIKIPVENQQNIARAIAKKSGKKPTAFRIEKRSIDARGGKVNFVYTVEVNFDGTPLAPKERLAIPMVRSESRPVIIGYGPCGMFAAYILAKAGLRPIVLERGKTIAERQKDVTDFHNNRQLNPHSNIQFGEGGAGTFSDGKLTTLIGSPLCAEVLETFIECGAPEEIRWLARPHIGTDVLRTVVTNLRQKTLSLGAEIRFETPATALLTQNSKIKGVKADEDILTDTLILAIGHSARDTLEQLYAQNIPMIPKAFSVGARIEHPQELINNAQYGRYAQYLGAADYKLSYHTAKGRGVYTFCMCPGGYVVGAASEENMVVTNGMSLHARDGQNANAALLVDVRPDDYGSDLALSGMYFQRELERAAFQAGGGNYNAPCQRLEDFLCRRTSDTFGTVKPTYLPGVTPSNLDTVLPSFVCDSMREALPVFARKIHGFDLPDALLTGVESRTSSPVRLLRNEQGQSTLEGLYPAGEGAGYAGGIMSAAVDGIKTALKIIEKLKD